MKATVRGFLVGAAIMTGVTLLAQPSAISGTAVQLIMGTSQIVSGGSGIVTLAAKNGTNNEEWDIDLESTANTMIWTFPTGINIVRLPNATNLKMRNSENTIDVQMMAVNASEVIEIGGGNETAVQMLAELRHIPDADTIADSGDANPATATLTPTGSYVEITCNDADTCDITMGETGISQGHVLTIVNVSANTVDFVDSAGVSELAGAFAAGQYDSISMVYEGSAWVETGRSNN